MIVVTHEMAFAREAADRVYFMDEGQFVEIGPPEQVLSNPKDERTRTFLSDSSRSAVVARLTARGLATAGASSELPPRTSLPAGVRGRPRPRGDA